mgnify:CR=1 FL=1
MVIFGVKMKKIKQFHCSLFFKDNSIIEDIIKAKDGDKACSILLSNEAIKRKTTYYWLKEQVIESLAKEVDNLAGIS